MSGSRKRGSKWNSKEEQQYSLENVRDKGWSAKGSAPFHDRESEHGYFSAEVGRKDKWSVVGVSDMMKSKHGMPSRESLHGSRGGEKDDNNDFVKNWKTSTPWDGDETYSMKMSPGLDDWRLKKRHSSPKGDWNGSHSIAFVKSDSMRSVCNNSSMFRMKIKITYYFSFAFSFYVENKQSRSWSRSRSISRSRSPVRSVRWQSGLHERTRNRSGVSTQLCKDFMAGRCRRGSQCHFLHQDIQSREDDYLVKSGRSTDCCTDYLKGNCRRGASCRFAHDGATDGFSRRTTNEISSERENTKRNRIRTPDRDGEREARRSSDIPCKFFASGNCHNGKYCRFSHHGQARASPDRRSRGDRGVWCPSSINVDRLQDGPTLRDTDASFNVNKSWNAPERSDANVINEAEIPGCDAEASNDANNSWTGSKWSDTGAYLGLQKMQHNYDVSGKNIEADVQYKKVDIDKDEQTPRKIENSGVNIGVSEPKGAEESLGDMEMSPEWNYKIQSSIKKELSHGSKPALVETLLHSQERNITKAASDQVHDGLAALPMLTEKSNVHQDHLMRCSSGVALPCVSNALNTVGQSQVTIPSNEVTMEDAQNGLLFQEEKRSNELNIGDANVLHGNSGSKSTQTMVSNEQLTQLTNLSASLAQLFGKGQQLPLLHAALNAHNGMQVTSIANSGGHIEPDSMPNLQPDQDITFPKQYDPISDSIEPAKKQGTDTKPLGFSIQPVAEKNTDGQSELSAYKLLPSSLLCSNNDDDYHNDLSSKREPDFDSHKPNQLEPVASSEAKKKNEGVEETKKAEGENGPSESGDADDKTDEAKKNKDSKGIRAFKFALVEFVKDLLKPTWKEGQIGKEAYKNIVKKVVDKVIATVQGTNIPQTPEKIDQYLSFSKPKLSKLVQAYVEKFQKS
ncbi:hypothetical protein ERO13_A11G227302v2 [Gossypium hirsutum]|nr:hypothetical protein ERO13_A11G227302v2 [Gossypium hirsutum]